MTEINIETAKAPDPSDQASLQEEMFRSASIAAAAAACAPERHPDFDGVHCLDCGDEIPEGRLQMKRIRCVYCQTAKEKRL